MQENPETAPAIDWSYYKKHISAGSMVDQFQKEYESLKIPYPADTYTSLIEDQEKDAVKHNFYPFKNFINKIILYSP